MFHTLLRLINYMYFCFVFSFLVSFIHSWTKHTKLVLFHFPGLPSTIGERWNYRKLPMKKKSYAMASVFIQIKFYLFLFSTDCLNKSVVQPPCVCVCVCTLTCAKPTLHVGLVMTPAGLAAQLPPESKSVWLPDPILLSCLALSPFVPLEGCIR